MEKKFRFISIIFIVSCIIFYGARFAYYYLKFNKSSGSKDAKDIASIVKKDNEIVTEKDGLYNLNGELVFRGKEVNNYLLYSNILWRIVKVNTDNSILLVTDSTLSNLAYSKDSSNYIDSNIDKWLNKSKSNTGIVESKLNDKDRFLKKTLICLDAVNNLEKITCKKKENKYVSLPSAADYLNSKNTDSYMNNIDGFWLSNYKDKDNVWFVSKGNISNDKYTNTHSIKATITLKNNINVIGGNGTKDEPYQIENQNGLFNSYVKLGNDLYNIYDFNDKEIKLVNSKLINNNRSLYLNYSREFDPTVNTSLIAYYLNTTYYNSLTYKDKLISCDYYTGDYDINYSDIYKKKVSAKVGLLSIADINLDQTLTNYFLLNKNNDKVSSINNGANITNKLRPTICIDKNTKLIGNGTLESPYELEG